MCASALTQFGYLASLIGRSNFRGARGAIAMNQVALIIQSRCHLYTNQESHMNLNLSIGPLISLLAGILILVMPKLLNYIVALYLIIIGLLGLLGTGSFHLR